MENEIKLEQKIIEVLELIADKLGTGAEHFWPLFIREQIVQGIIFSFIFYIYICFVENI